MGDYRTEIDVRGVHKLLGDEVVEAGGQDAGPMPTELLLASLCSCLCLAVYHIARKRRLDLGALQVHARADKDMQAFRFQAIDLEVEADLPADRLEALVDRARKFCFVSNTVAQGCRVRISTASTRSVSTCSVSTRSASTRSASPRSAS